MIFPGHIAASLLCHRHLNLDLRLALVAAVIPDLVDKLAYYGLHIVPSSRVPMHTLVAWLGSTLLVLLAAWVCRRPALRAWGFSWFLSYGAHLLCDSPLVAGKLPFLWPFLAYDFSSPHLPLGFVWGLDDLPVITLLAETLLVAVTVYLERRWLLLRLRRWLPQAASRAP